MGFSIKSKATQQQLLGKSAARKNALKDKTVMAAVTCAPPPANDLCPELKIVQRDIGSIQKPNRQLRRASKGKIAALARSIKALRQVAPILIDKHDRVVDGWNVVLAMRGLGADQVSCICLDHLTGEQVTAARISLNKLNEGSESDLDDLKASFEKMQLVDFDLEATGFSLQELDIILEEPASGIDADNAAEVPEAPAVPVSQLGDLWTLGEHMLLCGDALDERSYSKILGIRRADAVFTDAPWNIPIEGFVSGLGKKVHKNFRQAAGEMSDEASQTFCDKFTQLLATNLEDGGVLFSCIDWRSIDKIVAAGRTAGLRHINTVVWDMRVLGS